MSEASKRVIGGGLVAALTVIALCACTGTSHPATTSSGSTSAAPHSGLATLPAESPVANGHATAPPNGPTARAAKPGDLSAIVTTAKASTHQVEVLHDIAVSAGRPGAIPPHLISATATTVAATLRKQVGTAGALRPAANTPQAQFAAALHRYAALADSLAAWNTAAHKPLAPSFFTALATTDKQWKASLRAIGALAHRNLLANMPTLLLPR